MAEEKVRQESITVGKPAQIDATTNNVPSRRNPLKFLLDSAIHARDVVVEARQQVYGADREAEKEEREREIFARLNASQEQRRINITREAAVTLGLAAPFLWAGVSWGESSLGRTSLGKAL